VNKLNSSEIPNLNEQKAWSTDYLKNIKQYNNKVLIKANNNSN
jgi:hypothetical protein